MLAWIAPLIVFGIVVFVHELGHFLAAKAVGVYAPRFSIGFGKTLWKRRRGETEYVIAALPLGGYVRLASKEDEATAFLEGGNENSAASASPKDGWDPDAMIPFGPKPIPENRWMESQSLWGKLLIMLAGVTMNLILGYLVLTGMFIGYGQPYLSTRADSLLANRPAAQAGMHAGDSILTVNGEPLKDWDALLRKVGASAGVPLALGVIRDGARHEFTVTPVGEEGLNPETGKKETAGKIGIIGRAGSTRIPVGDAMAAGARATAGMATSVLTSLKQLATREVSAKELGGPIAIAQASVQAARGGFEPLLLLIAFISINLAVFNLLPIPILDGGQILIMLLEAAKGSPFSMKTREYVLKAGLGAILLLVAFVMYNDIRRLVQTLFGV
ncbi:MAG: RIP metalloprotease RseP [Gemmatimonadaceae bacterium]|nr:RIP metalloprotease RseP [Gemmatimonadaceae bacterium]